MAVVHKKNLKPLRIYYALFISGALNIVCLLGFAYVYYFGQTAYFSKEPLAKTLPTSYALLTPSMEIVLREYSSFSFEGLCREVEKAEHVEQGFCKSDLALAILVSFYQIDIERAMGSIELERRAYAFAPIAGEKAVELHLYPGIKGEKLQQIQRFLSQEIYPFTTQGLFEKIQADAQSPKDLVQTFMMSDEFLALHLALSKARESVPKDVVYSMVFEGDWELFERYSAIAKRHFKQLEMGPLFKDYIQAGSNMAAYLAILLEKEYVLKHFSDDQLMALLEKIEPKNLEVTAFLKDIMLSMRQQKIQTMASSKLHMPSQPVVETVAVAVEAEVEQDSAYTWHQIKEGETLWGLSRNYGVDVEMIKRENSLSSSKLIPGKKLKIPGNQ